MKKHTSLSSALSTLSVKPLVYVISFASTLLLVGCGSGNQDRGTPNASLDASGVHVFKGVAVDGHLARATVFIDTNNNGTRDAWEPKAFTDNDGYYSFNPKLERDYCAEDATEEDAQYCLKTPSDLDNVVVRVDGGYDKLTGEPFTGQLSRRMDASEIADGKDIVITPISTLIAELENSNDQAQALTNLGLSLSDLDVDYLNTSGNNEVDAFLLNTALKVHKTITILSDRIDDNYPELEDETGLPNTSSQAVYQGLANRLSQSANNIDSLLSDNSTLVAILDNAEARIRETYSQRGLELPADIGSLSSPGQFDRTAAVAQRVPAVVNRLLDAMDVAMDQGQVIGNARALETLIIKATSDDAQVAATIDNAFDFFLNDDNEELIEAVRIALSDDNADINGLAGNDFTGNDFDSAEEVRNPARVPDDAQAFSNLTGMRVLISDLDLGSPNDLKDIEVEVNFQGEADALSGSIVACAKYIDGASSDGTLGEGNVLGEVVAGYWSLLGADANNPSSYSLLLTFDFLGAEYQAIMKPAGQTTINGQMYEQIRFDYDGDIRAWHSQDGLVPQNGLPTSNADCMARLPSRVGL